MSDSLPIAQLAVKAGELTTEYQQSKAAGNTGKIAFWAGLLGTIASVVAGSAIPGGQVAVIASGIVTVAGMVVQTLAANKYAQVRTDIKTSADNVAIAKAENPVAP